MDIAIAGQHLDLTSLGVGAVVARALEAAAVRAIKPLPRMAVAFLKTRLQAAAAAGKIDTATLSLLKDYARATFAWVDAELPDAAGPAKMAAALDRLAAVPYLGVVIRADRDGAQQILQAAYDSIDAEAKAEALELAAKKDATPPTTPPAAVAGIPTP